MFCDLGDVSVYYETHGEGIPVLLIHGFTPDHRLMKGCFEPLFAKRTGYQRIYLDLPGMGRTKGEEWIQSSDEMLDVVERFIERVVPEGSYLLAGESYGGYLARGLAARKKERIAGLLFLCPLIQPLDSNRMVPPASVIARDEAFVATLPKEQQDQFTSIAVVQDRTNWEQFARDILPGLQVADREFLRRISKRYAFSFDLDHEQFDKPALFLTGRQDHVTGYADVWAILDRYPRASFAVLDRAGHNLQIEQSHLFRELVEEWLERVAEYENLQ